LFKRLTKLLFVVILMNLFVIIPIFAFTEDKPKDAENYEMHLAQMRKEIQSHIVYLMIITPKREGRDAKASASGVVIFRENHQAENFMGEVIEYNRYYILTNPHVVGEKNGELKRYKEDNVRIYVLGKNDRIRAQAEIVAWQWNSAALLLKVDIPKSESEYFKFQAAKIADKLPISLYDSKYSDKNVNSVYLSGNPSGYPVINLGYVSTYITDFNFNSYMNFTKAVAISAQGWNGSGQSGAGVFNQNGELIAIIFGGPYSVSNLIYAVPIDIIVERFLKKLPEFKDINLPNFELNAYIKYRRIYIDRPVDSTANQDNQKENNSKK